MAEPVILAIGVVVWWTFAVAALAIIMQSERFSWRIFGAVVAWPMMVPLMMIAIPYRAVVLSSRVILDDLRNRKLMKEFDEFLAQKEGRDNG